MVVCPREIRRALFGVRSSLYGVMRASDQQWPAPATKRGIRFRPQPGQNLPGAMFRSLPDGDIPSQLRQKAFITGSY